MISRSDWEPLPKPTLSPFARGYLSLCRFFTAAVWCVPALRVPLVHSLINHFRQKIFPLMPHYLVLCTYAVRSGYAYPSALLWVDPLINKVGPCQKELNIPMRRHVPGLSPQKAHARDGSRQVRL